MRMKRTESVLRPLIIFFLYMLLGISTLASSAGASEFTKRGWELIQAGKSDKALGLFRQAISNDQKNFEAHFDYQLAMTNMGRHDELQAEYKEFLRKHNDQGFAYFLYAATLNNANEFISTIRYGNKINPNDPLILDGNKLADIFEKLDQGKYDEVLIQLNEVGQKDLMNTVHQTRSIALLNLGKFEDAELEAKEALEILPFDPDSYLFLGMAYIGQAKMAEALKTFRQAAKLRNSPNNQYWVATLLNLNGRAAEGKKLMRQIMQMPLITVEDYAALAFVSLVMGDTKKSWEYAYEYQRRSLPLNGQIPIISAESALFGYKAAREHSDRLLKDLPNNLSLLTLSASLYGQQCCHDDAALEYEKVLRISPKDYAALAGKSHALIEMGKSTESLQMSQRILEIYPNNAWAYYNMAAAYNKLGQTKTAEQYAFKSLKRNPDNIYAWVLLGKMAIDSKEPKAAEKYFLKARQYAFGYEEKTIDAWISWAEQGSSQNKSPSSLSFIYSKSLENVINESKKTAKTLRDETAGVKHLLLALLKSKTCHAVQIINKMHLAPRLLSQDLQKMSVSDKHAATEKSKFDSDALRVLSDSYERAYKDKLGTDGRYQITTAHFLIGIVKTNNKDFQDILSRHGLVYEKTDKAVAEFYSRSNRIPE